jgi:type VI secretion system protein ImpK
LDQQLDHDGAPLSTAHASHPPVLIVARFRLKLGAPSEPQVVSRSRGQLALALQEPLTAIVRLRDNRQSATHAEVFRARMKQLLADTEREARQAGYGSEDVRLAIYAVVVFLDETVLNSSLAMFSDWPRRPLQEELFGGHTGGEVFFQNLQQLLARQESDQLADLLEVHQLCLLLGFQGRYSRMDRGELRGLTMVVSDKIQRIRGRLGDLSPAWALPSGESVPRARDPWVGRLGIALVVTLVLAAALFALFHFTLLSQMTELQAIAR